MINDKSHSVVVALLSHQGAALPRTKVKMPRANLIDSAAKVTQTLNPKPYGPLNPKPYGPLNPKP